MDTKQMLAQIFGENKVALSTREVALHKVTVRTMKPVLDLLTKVISGLRDAGETLGNISTDDPSIILKLISNHFDDVVEISTLLSDMTLEEVYALEADDSLILVQAIVLLNKDFFTKKVLPALGLMQESRDVPAA